MLPSSYGPLHRRNVRISNPLIPFLSILTISIDKLCTVPAGSTSHPRHTTGRPVPLAPLSQLGAGAGVLCVVGGISVVHR